MASQPTAPTMTNEVTMVVTWSQSSLSAPSAVDERRVEQQVVRQQVERRDGERRTQERIADRVRVRPAAAPVDGDREHDLEHRDDDEPRQPERPERGVEERVRLAVDDER